MFDLAYFASYSFKGKNEQAVREEWIYPLLLKLGYGGATLNGVLFEDRLQLREPVRRLGSTRLEVDYRPTILGHNLWIIEAKAPQEDLKDWDAHIGQAWSYATHPEVNVPLMVISDGLHLRVYEVTQSNWDEPIIDIRSEDIALEFDSIADVLGAKKVASWIYQRHLNHLEKAAAASLDLKLPTRIVSDAKELANRVRPIIGNNRADVLDSIDDEYQKTHREILTSAGLWGIAQSINVPHPFVGGDLVC